MSREVGCVLFHFRNRWFSRKRKSKAKDGVACSRKAPIDLEIIHEDMDVSELSSLVQYSDSLVVEWAPERLPIRHTGFWVLSQLSMTINTLLCKVLSRYPGKSLKLLKLDFWELRQCPAVSSKRISPVLSVPLVWKLHSLSAALPTGMDVLEDETTRIFYGYLQDLYGQFLDEARLGKAVLGNDHNKEFLSFKSDVHEIYATFLETLVEQCAAVSYGDMVYGRQVSVYLHQCVEPSVRLSAWTLLSNAHVLELLPPLENCTGDAKGYFEPFEDNEAILEAYLKSWKSGALDRSAMRGSMAYRLVLHHFSSFIFCHQTNDKPSLQNKLVKSLLRDYSQKQHRERTLLSLIRYNKQSANPVEEENRSPIYPDARCRGKI